MFPIKKLGDSFNRMENAVSIFGMCAGLILIFVNVVARYIFLKPIAEIEEIIVIVLAWAIIVGFSIDLGDKSHICMDVVYDAIKSEKVRRGLDLFAYLVGALYSGFIAFYGYQAVALQHKTGRVYPVTEIPRWIAYLIIVLVGVAMLGRYIVFLVKFFKGKKEEK